MTESTERLSLATLAVAKGLPPEVLRGFGVSDDDDGVRFAFRTPSGGPGRTRLRTALHEEDDCSWMPGDTAPVVAYCTPGSLDLAHLVDYQIVVESEPDCWTAWFHGVPAVGIPGAENWRTLTLEHFPVSEVFVPGEGKSARTFPGGPDAYVEVVTARIRQVGFTGVVHRLRLDPGIGDLGELYQRDRTGFADAVRETLARSRGPAPAGPEEAETAEQPVAAEGR